MKKLHIGNSSIFEKFTYKSLSVRFGKRYHHMCNNVMFKDFQEYVKKNIISFLSEEMAKRFEIYFNELIEWNKKFNLISYKEEKDILYRHFCDCLYSAKIVSELEYLKDVKVADLGTGSGMPGIPVKIALADAQITLVESISKKCKFLENVNNKLKSNIEILNARAEEIGQNSKYRSKYDFVLSRAVSKFSPNLEIAIPLLKVGGYFLVHKTKDSVLNPEEGLASIENAIKHLGAKLEKTISYNLPNQELDYCVLVFKKYKDTPLQFPRKIGIPEKKPL
ncbi:MAG: 16S rRNA (guanine(527)-N(7))-methyltransferase RsmG [Endomicrobium sp.]|jgi:16S rRNA (guanine527-N7)-methyltransferase|nr:16S rRNA (guanine(527)-N(7))-methyltransferase RsmG [Endomicrobium sp.]